MLYSLQDESFTDHLRENQKQNAKIVDSKLAQVIMHIENLFNIQHEIAFVFFKALIVQEMLFRSVLPSQQLLFSTYHKNALSLFAALELTRTGLHGAARANLRQAFEALMLAKYCSLTADERVLEKWASGKHLSLGREVIKNIAKPNPQPFWTLWGILSDYTHATVYSQQLSVQIKHEAKEVNLNFVLIQALLECNYHLLNSHFASPKLTYYANAYGKGEIATVPELRRQARSIFRETHKRMAKGSTELITAYKRKWTFKA